MHPCWSALRYKTVWWLRGSLLSACALFVLALLSCGDEGSLPFEPAPEYTEIESYSLDARILAARTSSGPWIDLNLAAQIEAALRTARQSHPEFDSIHAFPDFVLYEVIVKTTVGPVREAWQRGDLMVGDAYLDSLGTVFGLDAVDSLFSSSTSPGWFVLRFRYSLNTPAVAKLYEQSPQTFLAERNGYFGDGDQIWAFKKEGIWHMVFSEGRGDCPSGCTWRSFFYVEVASAGAVTLIDERIPGGPPPKSPIRLWNIPERFSITIFGDVDNLFGAFEDDAWWVRRHAIEATWRLLVQESPSYGEDIGDVWAAMRAGALERADEAKVLIQSLLDDPDEDVRASAENALEAISGIPPPVIDGPMLIPSSRGR